MGVPFLGSIPLEPRIVESGDDGTLHLSTASAQGTKAQLSFISIVDNIINGEKK
jgi:hypothetical protein